jgi:hypothetical protein
MNRWMKPWITAGVLGLTLQAAAAQMPAISHPAVHETPGAGETPGSASELPKIVVPMNVPAGAVPQEFHDKQYGVGFMVPAGWEFSRADNDLSNFHLDVPSLAEHAELRGVASMSFNPYPRSTLSSAIFYYSVEPHVKKAACADEASGSRNVAARTSIENIGGRLWTHAHQQVQRICVEARDDVYTQYRRHSCYRFDLEINTFCAISSGAMEISDEQVDAVQQRMDDILSSVALDWAKHAPKLPFVPKKLSEPTPAPAPPQSAGT